MSSSTTAGLISLVPSSGIQFVDIDFDIDRLPRGSRSYWEEMLREQQTIAESLKDLADEAKEKGFDVAAIRKAASLRINSKARRKYEKSTKTLLDLMEAIDDPLVVR